MTAPLPLTISERVRRMNAPTEPPRYAVYALLDGEDAACLRRDDDPELALDLAAQKLAEAAESREGLITGKYDRTIVAVVERDRPLANLYEQRVHVQEGSTVIPPAVYIRESHWCPACEACHSASECGGES